ncbi:MAG: carboxypeptidase regulatory-like domain-containing protein, partial [Candidatus Eisenbacteria bacterium]
HAPPVFAGAWGVYPFLPSGTILVSDIQTGLYTIRIDPDAAAVHVEVRDGSNGEPVAAHLEFPDEPLEPGLSHDTREDGALDLFLSPGTRAVVARAFGFAESTSQIVVDGAVNAATIELTPLPSGSVAGAVRGAGGDPISGVHLTIAETPLTATTVADGTFSFDRIPEGTWSLEVRRFGYRGETLPIEVASGGAIEQEIALVPSPITDDFEADRGWTVGASDDDATSGIWIRGEPIGTGGTTPAPGADHSEDGTDAFVTGNGGGQEGDDDVDGGKTTLFSPSYDLSQIERPWLELQVWYASGDAEDPLSDVFSIDASSDGGATWTNLRDVSTNTDGWREERIAIGRFLQIGAGVRLRFVARDSGIGSIVEVGIDDLQIYPGREDEPYYDPLPEGVRLVLDPVFPNPFRDLVRVRFRTDQAGPATLDVFDAAGRRIRRIDGAAAAQGPAQIVWDGRADFGEPARAVPTGFVSTPIRGNASSESYGSAEQERIVRAAGMRRAGTNRACRRDALSRNESCVSQGCAEPERIT